MEALIAAAITGAVTLLGIFISSLRDGKKQSHRFDTIDKDNASTKTRIDERIGTLSNEHGGLAQGHRDLSNEHKEIITKQNSFIENFIRTATIIEGMKSDQDKKDSADAHRYERISDAQRNVDKQLDAVKYAIEELHRLQSENFRLMDRIEELEELNINERSLHDELASRDEIIGELNETISELNDKVAELELVIKEDKDRHRHGYQQER